MQFDKDLESEHKALFLKARKYLLSFDGIVQTQITILFNRQDAICNMKKMPNAKLSSRN